MSYLSRLTEIDPQTGALIAAEERRQRDKIILIPSESLTPAPVREALGSVFTSVYAEGYPRRAMRSLSQERLSDIDEQLASYRRYADWRFYKGTELADLVESLAGRRASECFSTADVPAERIYANVQPLSGAAANLAVYDTFVEPGETVMGMSLTEGGHLTHGSEFNITGKRYRIVSYTADAKTGKLDYDEILRLAEAHRPRMIIAGFTSYPWQPDWSKFREIADAVGAILLADVAHTAGMIIGGVYPNPIGHADVVSFTTHKTLCGPRGAVILSTEAEIAARIDNAIFPGQQGGPHVNKFAAIAVALKLTQTPEFRDLQHRIVENAAHLAKALEKNSLTVAYGGTDTHLLLVDLRKLPNTTGFVMMGEIAARILDLAGIVCNKNTLPGDTSAADAHGIRLGTPWITQRGMGAKEMDALAAIIADILHAVRPFSYLGLTGELSRGKLPLSVLERAKRDVRSLLHRVDPDVPSTQEPQEESQGASPLAVIRVRGGRARALLNEAVPSDLLTLPATEPCPTYVFDENATALCEVVIGQIGREDYVVLARREHVRSVKAWLTGLAEGYVLFDPTDIFRKVQGPALVEGAAVDDLPEHARRWLTLPLENDVVGKEVREVFAQHPDRFAVHKPYFVGQSSLEPASDDRVAFSWTEPEVTTPQQTPLHSVHVDLGARLVPFAGWEMPVWYTSALEEHRAVREHAGLFDLGHMGVFQIEGEHAAEFLNVVTSNYADWLNSGQSQYAFLLDPDGRVLDDVFVYRRARDRYVMVVNAVNERKAWEWLNGVNDGRYIIDREIPARRPGPKVRLRDLKSERGVVDVALQGPSSRRILEQVLGSKQRWTLASLDRTEFCETETDGHQMLISRTGYTGEPLGYEIYVGETDAAWLWERLINAGSPLGLLPCGLAARDSTRTEAGLPLYGHELSGGHSVNPFEAGFGSYVKLHKPFFVGRSHCANSYREQQREIVRFSVESGARPVRETSAVLDRNGIVLGRVTSCVSLGDSQVGLALLERRGIHPGAPISLLNPPRQGLFTGATEPLQTGDRIGTPSRGTILSRFMERDETPGSAKRE